MHDRVPYGTSWYCPTAALSEAIVQVQRVCIQNFVTALVKHEGDRFPMKNDFEFEQSSGESLRDVIDRLLPHAIVVNTWLFKYGIEACLSRIVIKEFGKASVSELEEKGQDARSQRNDCRDEYQRLSLLSPVDAINPEGKVYRASFHLSCNREFDNIQGELKWQEEWPDNLVKDFLEVGVSKDFSNRQFVTMHAQVGFLVNPGYTALERIIKCQVYLSPDES